MSSPAMRPKRVASARAIGPYAWPSSAPLTTVTLGNCVRMRATSSPSKRLLPLPGSPVTSANASVWLSNERSTSSVNFAIVALRPVNFGRNSYAELAVVTTAVCGPSSSPKSAGSNVGVRSVPCALGSSAPAFGIGVR